MSPTNQDIETRPHAVNAVLPAMRRMRRPRMTGRECRLCGTLVLDGKRVPLGPCWVKQRRREATLTWTGGDGARQDRDLSNAQVRQLLDEGLLQHAGR